MKKETKIMINDDKLTEYLQSELEYMLTESNKRGTSDGEKAFERVGNKTKMLLDVLSCRTKSAAQVAATDIPFGTKRIILEMNDKENLIAEILENAK